MSSNIEALKYFGLTRLIRRLGGSMCSDYDELLGFLRESRIQMDVGTSSFNVT